MLTRAYWLPSKLQASKHTRKVQFNVCVRPVNEAHGVDAVQCQHNLSSVETCPLLRHIIVAHQVDQVSAWHILHHHVEVAVVLECIKQLDDIKKKKMIYILINISTVYVHLRHI